MNAPLRNASSVERLSHAADWLILLKSDFDIRKSDEEQFRAHGYADWLGCNTCRC